MKGSLIFSLQREVIIRRTEIIMNSRVFLVDGKGLLVSRDSILEITPARVGDAQIQPDRRIIVHLTEPIRAHHLDDLVMLSGRKETTGIFKEKIVVLRN